MKRKINDGKINISTTKTITSFKTQKTQNFSNKKPDNKLIRKPTFYENKKNQLQIKETKFQTELKPKNKYLTNIQKNNLNENQKEIKTIIKEEDNKKKNNIIKEEKNEDIIENENASIIINKDNNNNNNNNEIQNEEKDKNSYLKLSQEEINKLINNSKQNIKKSQSANNILKEALNPSDKNTLKNLTVKQKSLFNEIDKINLQKKFLNEYSLNNLPLNNIFYKNVQNDNIKNLKNDEKYILQKINLIEQEINKLNNKNNKNNKSKNNIIHEELKKKDLNKNYKELINENNIIYKKIKEDAELNLEKRNKEIDLMEKWENAKKTLELKEKIKYGKSLEKERKKEIFLEVVKNKPYINNKNTRGKKNNYLYYKMATSFEKKEEKLIKSHKNKLKINFEDIEKKESERSDYLEKQKLKMIENMNNLHQMWKERSNLLNKYKSPLYEKIIYSEENNKEEEKNKLENIKRLYYEKEKYCKEKIHLPPISNILRREREGKKIRILKNNSTNRKQINLSIDNFKNINKYRNNNININNKSKSINENKIQKDKKVIKSYSTPSIKKTRNIINNEKGKITINISLNKKKEKNVRNPNDFNYLEDLKKERALKNKNEINKINNNQSNLDFAKGQIQLMEEKYNRDKELLKVKGGYANNQEFGDQLSELLVNSIKNKLNLIENINHNEK